MAGLINKIKGLVKNRTTYRVGLLQAKAYRLLKVRTGEVLSKYNITTIDWALLGLLNDNKDGIKSSSLAQELGVEAPFITALFAKLNKLDLVQSNPLPNDNRVKIITLTDKGFAFVESTESIVRNHMRPLLSGVPMKDVLAYVSVLEKMIENSNKEEN